MSRLMRSETMEVLEYMFENSGYIMERLLEHIFHLPYFLEHGSSGRGCNCDFCYQARAQKTGKLVLSITGATQAVPSIAVIALVFLFMGIGAAPACSVALGWFTVLYRWSSILHPA